MTTHLTKLKKWVAIISIIILGITSIAGNAYAEGEQEGVKNYGISMSPMNQKIILNAGERYTGSFTINNPRDHLVDFKYKVTVEPFFVDENYKIIYREEEGVNQMVSWTTTDVESGTLALGESQKITFTIDVPKDAPAGGQYAAILVSSVSDSETKDSFNDGIGVAMGQDVGIAHIVYAEVAGTTRRSGEVINASVPGFLFDGEVGAESTIKNTGNTHGTATYKLQVFPLFSDEEVYTNEENPETKTILPNRSLTNRSSWKETPAMGIFNVKYTVEFEGVTTEVTKLVIKCPLWLMFIIIFVIVGAIIWLVIRIKMRKKAED